MTRLLLPSRFPALILFILTACSDGQLTSGAPQSEPGTPVSGDDGDVRRPDRTGVSGEVDPAGSETTEADVVVPGVEMIVTVPDGPVPVGIEVPVTVQILEGDADVTELWNITLQVVPATGVTLGDATVLFTIPGPHQVQARAHRLAQYMSASAHLDVNPGPVTFLSVTAHPDRVEAGQPVAFDVTGSDAFGNRVPAADLDVVLSLEPGGAIEPGRWSARITEVGRYEVHAELASGVAAVAVFHVTTSEPSSLLLTVDDYENLDPDDSLGYQVYVEDVYGNEIPTADVTVTLEPAAGARVVSRRVLFDEEGIYELIARIDGTDLEDRVGPLEVDGFAPVIDLKSPERGSYQMSSPVLVEGSVYDAVSGVGGLTINGTPVSLDRGGNFRVELEPELGINLLEVVAWDNDGHSTDIIQSYFHGIYFTESDGWAATGLIARANQGTLDMLEEWTEAAFEEDQVESLIMSNPRVWYDCVDLWLYEPCAWVDARYFSMSYLNLQLTPQYGHVNLYAGIRSPRVGIRLAGDTPTPTVNGSIGANWANVNAELNLWVDRGRIHASLSDLTVSMPGFWVSIGLPDWLSFVEGWIAYWVQTRVEDAIADAIADQAPAMINQFLSELEMGTSIDMYDTTLWVDAQPQWILIDPNGLSLLLKTRVTTDTVVDGALDGPGSLATFAWPPNYAATPEFMLSISDDFLNQAFYTVWESGQLGQMIERNMVSTVDAELIGMLVPGANGLEFELDPLLPPVFIPSLGRRSVGELQMGDMLVDAYATFPNGTRQFIARVAMSMFGRMSVTIDDNNTVEIGYSGDPEFFFDGIFTTLPNLTDDNLEDLLEFMLPTLMPQMIEGVQEFPLPSFSGLQIQSPSVSLTPGTPPGFINVGGNLVNQ